MGDASHTEIFWRVYRLPQKLTDGFCFNGGNPIQFLNVDWFNLPFGMPIPSRDDVTAMIQAKGYYDPSARFLVLDTRPGETFMIEAAPTTGTPITARAIWTKKAQGNGFGTRVQMTDLNRDDEDETDVTVFFTYRPGCPAQTYGPAERCYPAEDPEIEILAAVVGDDEVTLTDAETARMTLWIAENPEEDARDD